MKSTAIFHSVRSEQLESKAHAITDFKLNPYFTSILIKTQRKKEEWHGPMFLYDAFSYSYSFEWQFISFLISHSVYRFRLFTDLTKASANGTVIPEHNMSLHPYFNFDVQRNVTARVGQTSFLQCKVEQLGDKSVSFLSLSFFPFLNHTIFSLCSVLVRSFFLFSFFCLA